MGLQASVFLRSGKRAWLCAALLALLLAACADRVTRENYQRIEDGMTLAQVTEILGEPDDIKAVGFGKLSGSTAVWRGNDYIITIGFANGEVAVTSLNRR